ncbi:MAG: hypothetical protein HQ517_08490 [SAR324 cluster bacterium]|nr:hypothetical protein [SAR324 cluster bacterium]
MITDDKYIQSLRKLNSETYIDGKKTNDAINHPLARPSANSVAMTYHLAGKAEFEELMTAESHIKVPVNQRRLYHRRQDEIDTSY